MIIDVRNLPTSSQIDHTPKVAKLSSAIAENGRFNSHELHTPKFARLNETGSSENDLRSLQGSGEKRE